jgi:hypothetical protein
MYYKRYNHDKKLHIDPMMVPDLNTEEDMENIRRQVFEDLRGLEIAPGTQFHDVSWRSCMEVDEDDTIVE